MPPVSPFNVKVERTDPGDKMTVSWDIMTPEEAWGFIISYTVSYKKAEDESGKRQSMEKTASSTDSTLPIEDLDPGQDYIVTMWANTRAGMGKQSEPISTKGR